MSKSNTFETGKTRMPSELKSGERFGNWEVIERFGLVKRGGSNRTAYKFRCLCGTEKVLLGTDVYRNRIKSCGCIHDCGFEESAFRSTRKTYKSNASSRKLAFTLTDDELKMLFSSVCFYCTAEPANVTRKKRLGTYAEYRYSGIDRVDNAKGYTSGNCVPCCKTCNWMKQKMSTENFISHCRQIVKNFQ